MRTCLSGTGKISGCWIQHGILAFLFIFLTPLAAAAQLTIRPNLKALFAVVGRTHNIDPKLLEAMADVESGNNPLSVSPKGALGLMQLMPTTASAFSVLDPFNPISNVIGAADFIDYLRERFAGNSNLQGLPALLAAYNAGPGAVEKYGGVPPYTETKKYVKRVIERYKGDLSALPAAAPVLILGPKPYVIQVQSGVHPMQPEPVLISTGGDGSMLNRVTVVRGVHGEFLAAVGTGTAPWIRRAVHDPRRGARNRMLPHHHSTRQIRHKR